MSQNNGYIDINGVEIQVYDDTALNNALSGKANIAHSHTLADITDIDSTNKINGYALQYDSNVNKFVSKALPDNAANTTSKVIDLAKYGIVSTSTDLTATTENYRIAHANGVGFQNAINDAITNGETEIIIPPGDYPLCYSTDNYQNTYPIINASGINLSAYGCRFYVVYDDLDTGLNPYYTGDPTLAHAMCGVIFLTDHDIKGCEIVGERGFRTHPNTKYRDASVGIALNNYTNGNVIKDCKIHHISGDGIAMRLAMQQIASWNPTFTSVTWDGTKFSPSNFAFTSARNSIYWADLTKPMQIRSNMYFLYSSAPLKIHCFNQSETYMGTFVVNQGEPFYFLVGTYYWYLELTRTVPHDLTATETNHYALGYGTYYNTTIDSCYIYLNQRGGISNLPSDSKVKNCYIHHNGGAYGNMVAYFDGTQFGIDIEDWYIHRITIENTLINGSINAILYRCNTINIIDCVLYSSVINLNFGFNFYAKGTDFRGDCKMDNPTPFGSKTAINCTFQSILSPVIMNVDNQVASMATKTIPAGGSAGQVLAKKSAKDYDTQWVWQSSSGGTSLITTVTYNSNPVTPASSITFDNTTNIITITNHGLSNGKAIAFLPNYNAATTDLPVGLIYGRTYYVVNATPNTFQISETSGGSAKDFTSNGNSLNWHMEVLSAKQILINNLNLDNIRLVVYPLISSYSNASVEIFRIAFTNVGDGSDTIAMGGNTGLYSCTAGIAEVLLRGYNNFATSIVTGGFYGFNSSNVATQINNINTANITIKGKSLTSPSFPSIAVGVGFNNNPFLLNGFRVEVYNA